MKYLIAIVMLLGLGVAADVYAQAPTHGELLRQGWEPLFNGTDLSGWTVPEGDGGHWQVLDGVIDYDALSEAEGDKSLWTDRSYEDFQLRLDWRLKGYSGYHDIPIVQPDGSDLRNARGEVLTVSLPNADSGVYLRGTPKAQVNIWAWPVGSGEVYGYRTDESMPPEVRAGVTPSARADNPVGAWNTFLITMRDDRLTVELNGETVIENAQLPGIPTSGPIGLQHHGGFDADGTLSSASSFVQFRNIYIKEL